MLKAEDDKSWKRYVSFEPFKVKLGFKRVGHGNRVVKLGIVINLLDKLGNNLGTWKQVTIIE